MQGKIIKGIAGFYYVEVAGSGLYECKAKGIFRQQRIKPLVGDNVELEVLDAAAQEGNITAICPRRNELIRPAVANIDQALVVFAVARPAPHLNLLNRFLVMMAYKQIPVVLCFNKEDLAADTGRLQQIYRDCGYPLVFVSAREGSHMAELGGLLKGRTTVIAGPSGVGKSTLINRLCPAAEMATGEISRKIERGKHTTRHSELFALAADTYICDTPGFSSLFVAEMEPAELAGCFPEFAPYTGTCRFRPCTHSHEPGCAVKAAVDQGRIARERYESYVDLYNELKNKKRY